MKSYYQLEEQTRDAGWRGLGAVLLLEVRDFFNRLSRRSLG